MEVDPWEEGSGFWDSDEWWFIINVETFPQTVVCVVALQMMFMREDWEGEDNFTKVDVARRINKLIENMLGHIEGKPSIWRGDMH